MRKITLSVLSFALGALSMSLSGNQTSTSAQESTKRPPFNRVVPAIPVVPSFNPVVMDRLSLGGYIYSVDGILCRNCRFKDTTLLYAGGEYLLDNASVELPVRIELEGAALNTARFLNLFGLIGCHAKQTPPIAMPPILRAKYAPSGTLKSENAN